MKSLAKTWLVLLAALTMTALTVNAQTDSTATTTNKPAVVPKPRSKPYTGTIASVDSDAKTITVTLASGASQTIKVTSKTRIKKDGEPATLADIAAGQKVKGYGRKNEAGDWVATTINIGQPKPKAATPPPAAQQ